MSVSFEDRALSQRTSYCLVSEVFKLGVKRLRPTDVYTLGRNPRSRIHLASDTVSRHHATIRWTDQEGGGFLIQDKGSKNGLKVNGRKAMQHMLRDDDLIEIKPFKLRYRILTGDLDMILLSENQESEDTKPIEEGAETATEETYLSGRFVGSELLEICQLIERNRKSGRLEIQSAPITGWLRFGEGELIGASAGERAGLDALRVLLTNPQGNFTFQGEPPPKAGVKTESIKGLLRQLMRQSKERELSDYDPTRDTQTHLRRPNRDGRHLTPAS